VRKEVVNNEKKKKKKKKEIGRSRKLRRDSWILIQ
jgi:hypothetical protein